MVHVGSGRMDMFDNLGRPIVTDDTKQMDVVLTRQASGFGMNVKTLDSGRTVVTVPARRRACSARADAPAESVRCR